MKSILAKIIILIITIFVGFPECIMAQKTVAKPSYVFNKGLRSGKAKPIVVVSIYKNDDGKYAPVLVSSHDSIYPLPEKFKTDLNETLLENQVIAGIIRDNPVYVYLNQVEELPSEGESVISVVDEEREKKESAKAFMNGVIFGGSYFSGNFWYYLLAFAVLTIICGFFCNDGDEEVSVVKTCTGGILLILLLVGEFIVSRYGMTMINDWIQGDRDIVSILLIIPKCLAVLLVVFWQYMIWSKLMTAIGYISGGRKDISVSSIVLLACVGAVGIGGLFCISDLPMIMYCCMGAVVLDFLIFLFMGLKNPMLTFLQLALYAAGMLALFEMLCLFGLLLAMIIAVLGIVFFIGNLAKSPEIVATVWKNGVQIGKIYKGSKNVHFNSGASADVSKVSLKENIQIRYKDND